MMGNHLTRDRRWLRCQDGETCVNLECVSAYDLTVKFSGKPEGEIGFAGPSGAGNKNCSRRKHGNGDRLELKTN